MKGASIALALLLAQAQAKPTKGPLPGQGIEWKADFDAAVKEATARNVPILFVIHKEGSSSCQAMADSYKDSKIIEASRNFVALVAHQETAHGTKEVFVGREKLKLCNLYHTVPCESHTGGWGFVGRFGTGTFQCPSLYIADPSGKEILKHVGQLSAGDLVKKMNDGLARIPGEKVPLPVWQMAKQLMTDGEIAREKSDLKKAVEAYAKASKLRGGTIKADADAALKKLDEEGEKQLAAALAEASVDEKKKQLKRISEDFKPLPVAAKAKKELDAAR